MKSDPVQMTHLNWTKLSDIYVYGWSQLEIKTHEFSLVVTNTYFTYPAISGTTYNKITTKYKNILLWFQDK